VTRGDAPACAIVGGSGLYAIAAMENVRERRVDTPFGAPSDVVRIGTIEGRPVAFLARHGREHRLLPTEINYRANVFALKSLGVERILSVSAVGSMTERIRPRDVVVVDQFIDRTSQRPVTFFGDGIAVHVSLADPVCPEIRSVLLAAAGGTSREVHDGGTYVCIEGPAFSTRAESRLYRSWGADVIGMTNLPEARLAREAEMCYATLALATDYDCWHEAEEDVNVDNLLDNLRANSENAGRIVRDAVIRMPERGAGCSCANALAQAILTPLSEVPESTRRRLLPILARRIEATS
jgi:5'-methylthioadenosine phosphorylase